MADDDRKKASDDLSSISDGVSNVHSAVNKMKSASEAASSAFSNAAAGSAAGPAGAIAGVLWSFKNEILKFIAVIAFIILLLITFIASLPQIITKNLIGSDAETSQIMTLQSEYDRLSDIVENEIALGHESAINEIDKIISKRGYNEKLSKENITDLSSVSTGYDAAYILCAYSVSKGNRDTDEEELKKMLSEVRDEMFSVEYSEKKETVTVPAVYGIYKEVKVNVYVSQNETQEKTYYILSSVKTTDKELTADDYKSVQVSEAISVNGSIIGSVNRTYYEKNGTRIIRPEKSEIRYGVFNIKPFDSTVILKAFGIDEKAMYDKSQKTNGEIINDMTSLLRYALFGEDKSVSGGNVDIIFDGDFVSPFQHSDAYCSSEYGYRTLNGTYKLHGGIDLCCRSGSLGKAVNSISSGKVVSARTVSESGYGNNVIIDHGNGITSLYAHLDSFCVKPGDSVTKETIVGYAGNTFNPAYGGYSTGPHLHLEIRYRGEKVNPRKYINLPSASGW